MIQSKEAPSFQMPCVSYDDRKIKKIRENKSLEDNMMTNSYWEYMILNAKPESDTVRSAHSVAVADIVGDGEAEVIYGEHDPF